MRILTLLLLLLLPISAFAQQAPQGPPAIPADVQQVLTQIHQVGCNAEAQASAQTIAELQKENATLKAQIQKLDPPKSGATKK